jgi:hypothetical protein
VLSTDQHDEFRTTGLLRLGGALPQATAEAMCDRVWDFLASRYAIHRDERAAGSRPSVAVTWFPSPADGMARERPAG